MLSNYLTINERRDHCNLQSPCQLGTKDRARTRKTLMKYLGLTKVDVKGMDCCHLCPSDTNHGACTNPKHLYFGTPRENKWDFHYGHFNHHNSIVRERNLSIEPFCPKCGYYSASRQNRRLQLERHIKNNTCLKPYKGRLIHPDFIKSTQGIK